jgi:DinB superfamily
MATQHDVDELLRKMEFERGRLDALLGTLAESDAEFTPDNVEDEAQWSAKEQCSHLAEMEAAYRAWVEAGLREDNPDVTGIRGEGVTIPLEAAHAHTLEEHRAAMGSQRRLTLALIGSMQPADFDRTASHKWFGTLTLMQWLRSYYRHDRMHADQVSGREPEYKPKFTTGREPDQRRSGVKSAS